MWKKVHTVTIARQRALYARKNSCNEWGFGDEGKEAGKEVFKKGW